LIDALPLHRGIHTLGTATGDAYQIMIAAQELYGTNEIENLIIQTVAGHLAAGEKFGAPPEPLLRKRFLTTLDNYARTFFSNFEISYGVDHDELMDKVS
jgi:hypothetical protein